VFAILVVIHLLISLALVMVILLQAGKGGGLAGAFGGGGGSQTIFGGRGAASFLSKATAILGAAFMISSMSLALVSTRAPAKAQRSVIEDVIRREQQQGQPSERLPEPVPGGAAQQQTPAGQPATAPEAGSRTAPGAGLVPAEVLPPASKTAGESEKAAPQTQPETNDRD
jgi:preprotein translocase subunit SecG